MLLLLDYWPLGRLRPADRASFSSRIMEKLPFLAFSVTSCVITIVAQRAGGAMKGAESIPLSLRVGNAILAYAEYIGKFFYPVHLAVFYPHPGSALSWGPWRSRWSPWRA